MILTELYSDPQILIINKPASLLVHKSHATAVDEPTVIDLLFTQYKLRLKAVHRLDRATSGVLLLARTSESAAFYGKQFQDRSVTKEYRAITRGFIDDQTIDYPLKHLEKPELIQDAKTAIKRLATAILPFSCGRYPESRYSLVALNPLSGRRHQLRRHLKHVFHPIIGDTVYGHGIHNRLFRERLDCHRLLLHNRSLSFQHTNGERFTIEAPFDETFQRVLEFFT